jgi:hypothetical protein
VGEQAGNLSCIELRIDSIESFWVNGFELHGIDAPLIRRDLQPIENGWQGVVDMAAFVVAHDAAGPVDQVSICTTMEPFRLQVIGASAFAH